MSEFANAKVQETGKVNRRNFLKTVGFTPLALLPLSELVLGADQDKGVQLIEYLKPSEGFVQEWVKADGAQKIRSELESQQLQLKADFKRSKAFRVMTGVGEDFKPQTIELGVLPFTKTGLDIAGCLSVSKGGLAAGTHIKLRKMKEGPVGLIEILEFTTYTMVQGKVEKETFQANALDNALYKAEALARVLPAGREKPMLDVGVSQVNIIAAWTFGELVSDMPSQQEGEGRTPREIQAILDDYGIFRINEAIARFHSLRHSGSPSGCSTCSSSYGCCSSSCSWV